MVYAGFWRRAASWLIDFIILWVVNSIFVNLYLWRLGVLVQDVGGLKLQVISNMAYMCLFFTYFSAAHAQWGCTVGKKLLGVKVVDSKTGGPLGAGQAMGRSVAILLSHLTFGIGYAMAGWDSKKRALHDRVAGTVCIRI